MSDSELLSIIVPSRGRVDGLRRLLDSLRATVDSPQSIEVVVVADEDDAETVAFAWSGLACKRVVVPAGQTMGNLNLAGSRAANGGRLMLLNDDVVARTPGWDAVIRRVLRSYPDEIVLVHINELIFHDRLCTFPLLTRGFCELAGGICRPEYRRYRIDDHIHHVFDLIHVLGHTRRVYLPDVVFEHHNVQEHEGGREYVPNPEIHAADTVVFEALIGERRRLAVECVERIEGPSDEATRDRRLRLLETFPDSVALRRREHVRIWTGDAGAPDLPVPAPRPVPARGAARIWNTLAQWSARGAFSLPFGVPAVMVDAEWYRSRHPDAAGVAPLLHYLRVGAARGYDPNPHFHTAWYLANNPDVASSGLNPLVHFVRFGAREGRDPNLFFDVHYYRRQNPEAAAPGVNPLAHFLSTPADRRASPNAALSLDRYLQRLENGIRPARAAVSSPAPLSVIIPTKNRAGALMRTLDACARQAVGVDVEFVVVDDGSTDSTAELLRARAAADSRVSFYSLEPGGPARARNFGAAHARNPVLLFIGDDIAPADASFFAVHSRRHAEDAAEDFAVLGKVSWPDEERFRSSFLMRRIVEDGSQFAFSRLTPGEFAGWQYFYTSNLSVKRALVGDWMTRGFDPGFPGAAFEDVEFAYRMRQSGGGLRLLYDPAATGFHDHPYNLAMFLERQFFAGRSLRRVVELHPELADFYGLRVLDEALGSPVRAVAGEPAGVHIAALYRFAQELEQDGRLGVEEGHGALLSALFELRLHEGYVAAAPGNRSAAEAHLLQRVLSRAPILRTVC